MRHSFELASVCVSVHVCSDCEFNEKSFDLLYCFVCFFPLGLYTIFVGKAGGDQTAL